VAWTVQDLVHPTGPVKRFAKPGELRLAIAFFGWPSFARSLALYYNPLRNLG
jgi:hypothetical protein